MPVAEAAYDHAVKVADEALARVPNSVEIADCRARALNLRQQETIYTRGREALQRGDVPVAFFAFAELDDESPFRARPEIKQARDRFAELQLEQAQAQVQEDPDGALRTAQTVASMDSLPISLRRRAQAPGRPGAVASSDCRAQGPPRTQRA